MDEELRHMAFTGAKAGAVTGLALGLLSGAVGSAMNMWSVDAAGASHMLGVNAGATGLLFVIIGYALFSTFSFAVDGLIGGGILYAVATRLPDHPLSRPRRFGLVAGIAFAVFGLITSLSAMLSATGLMDYGLFVLGIGSPIAAGYAWGVLFERFYRS